MFQKSAFALAISLNIFALSASADTPEGFEQGPKYDDLCKVDMKKLGEAMQSHGVREVIFVHGTFVGTDDFGVVGWLSNKLKIDFGTSWKNFKDRFEVGNYTPNYVNEFCRETGKVICQDASTSNFVWSSGNYHAARLMGAIDLAQWLSNRITRKDIKGNESILLIGHSHAGQLFALLTNFLADNEQAKKLFEFADSHKDFLVKINDPGSESDKRSAMSNLKSNLEKIRKVKLDFVTFGTPIRYAWEGNYPNFRLMDVINHRSPPDILGVFEIPKVGAGDYVQQWGVSGTDTINRLVEKEVEAETNLSEILADEGDLVTKQGIDFQGTIAIFQDGQRHPPKGAPHAVNVVVDYNDNYKGRIFSPPDFAVKKVFGHGVYTTTPAMAYNTQLIVKKLYP